MGPEGVQNRKRRMLRGSGRKIPGEKRLDARIPAAGRIASLAEIGRLVDRTAGRYLFQDTRSYAKFPIFHRQVSGTLKAAVVKIGHVLRV